MAKILNAEEREAKLNEMAEHRANAEKACLDINAAMLDEDSATASRITGTLEAEIKEYNDLSKMITYSECAAAEDPMVELAHRLTYPTIKQKNEKIEDSDLFKVTIVTDDRQLDPYDLHVRINGGIGHDHMWPYMIETMNVHLTIDCAESLGIKGDRLKDISDSLEVDRILAAYDDGKNPLSNTNFIKNLTAIVQAMLGESYKPLACDVNYLKHTYAKKSRKALTVTVSNVKGLRMSLMNTLHRIVTGGVYDIDGFQTYKKAAKK